MDDTLRPEPDRPTLAELAAEANRRKGRVRLHTEGNQAVDHDARCDNQDTLVQAAMKKTDELAKDVKADELRLERLISDMEHLMDRVPEHLGADIATLSGKVTTAIRDLDELKTIIRSDFVTRAELDPIRRLVYGVVGLILTAVIGGLLGLVILK